MRNYNLEMGREVDFEKQELDTAIRRELASDLEAQKMAMYVAMQRGGLDLFVRAKQIEQKKAYEIVAIENSGNENKVPVDQYLFKFLRKTKSGTVFEEVDNEISADAYYASLNQEQREKQKKEEMNEEERIAYEKEWQWDKSESYYSEDERDRDTLMQLQFERKVEK